MERFQGCIERRDRTAADAVLDPDFALLLVQPARAVMPRKRWLEVLEDYVVDSYAVKDQVIDAEDDVAVVLHRDEMSATVLGQDRSGTFTSPMYGGDAKTDGGSGGDTPRR